MNSATESMRALVLESSELALHTNYPVPHPQPGEALIRVLKAGICSTDLELAKGYAGGFRGVLGHEFVGVVAACDDADWLGKRVVATINIADPGSPEFAEYGDQHHPGRTVLGIVRRDGAFADFVALPIRNLLEVPESVSTDAAVFTEPLAAALRIAEQTRVQPSAKILVIGAGRLGLLVARVLSLNGADVTVAGRSLETLELPRNWGLRCKLVNVLEDDAYGIVVEATGNEEGLGLALRAVKPTGKVVLKSTYAGAATVDLTKVVVGEVQLIGSRCGPFEPALRLLANGSVDPGSMIDAEYGLDEGLKAMTHAAKRGVRKVLLRVSE